MQVFAIPRLDASGSALHVLWSWPDGLPLSIKGYDLLRLEASEGRPEIKCEVIDQPRISLLRTQREIQAELGRLRLRQGCSLRPLYAGVGLPVGGFATAGALKMDCFAQELDAPTDRATVRARARFAMAIALSRGKAIATATPGTLGTTMVLNAPAIDTILVYAFSAEEIEICIELGAWQAGLDWRRAVVIAQGLTLPIHEADAALATPAQELTAARKRLVGGEALVGGAFASFASTLREPVKAGERGSEAIVLTRAATDQSYEEIPLEMQLGGMALHPKIRRVLGFGFADDYRLTPGRTYVYRLTGRFETADLGDSIYDLSRVPAGTTLPASFALGALALRFQTPVQVVLYPVPPTAGLNSASRRGVCIDTSGFDSSWLLPELNGLSAVITFPQPVTHVVLEVDPDHSFTFAAGLPWLTGWDPAAPLPPGATAVLDFATPIQELRLGGTGVLFAIRLRPAAAAGGVVEQFAYSLPVVFAAQPLPEPPLSLTIDNLQQPATPIPGGTIDETTALPHRMPIGFKLDWLPAPNGGVSVWPDDLGGGPPLDAIAYQIEHREVVLPSTFGAWEPIAGDDNLTLGSRDMTADTRRIEAGCDLHAIFPARRPPSASGGLTFTARDIFGEDPSGSLDRPVPPPGTHHQYAIRAMDAVGRVSATATLSNILRLEKHVPPPLPVGPQPAAPQSPEGHFTAPSGPRARAIVQDAPGLTPADVALLGAHDNAILLEWGWRQAERDIDPFATEFRVYATQPPDVINATVTAVGSAPPHWQVSLTTDLPLVAGELVGQWLTIGNYPFRVAQSDGGTTPALLLELAVVSPTAQPVTGALVFGRPLRPEHQQGANWDERVAVVPIGPEESIHTSSMICCRCRQPLRVTRYGLVFRLPTISPISSTRDQLGRSAVVPAMRAALPPAPSSRAIKAAQCSKSRPRSTRFLSWSLTSRPDSLFLRGLIFSTC